ncbi:MAG TPA: hypothetical protein VLH19_02300 [Patescibacteria group bacterium]|nr:hypothetical protein [Patescibacteria group bacterium]
MANHISKVEFDQRVASIEQLATLYSDSISGTRYGRILDEYLHFQTYAKQIGFENLSEFRNLCADIVTRNALSYLEHFNKVSDTYENIVALYELLNTEGEEVRDQEVVDHLNEIRTYIDLLVKFYLDQQIYREEGRVRDPDDIVHQISYEQNFYDEKIVSKVLVEVREKQISEVGYCFYLIQEFVWWIAREYGVSEIPKQGIIRGGQRRQVLNGLYICGKYTRIGFSGNQVDNFVIEYEQSIQPLMRGDKIKEEGKRKRK